MDAARDHAAAAGYRCLWLITTNDKARAFRLYQQWGMNLCFYCHCARRSWKVKPALPQRGPTVSRWTTSSILSCSSASRSALPCL